jgi:hypothetical protein
MGIGVKIILVIVIDKVVPQRLAEDQKYRHHQQNTDANG